MGLKDLINRLNARGLRRSGAKGYGLRKNQLNYDRNLSDVLSQLMQQVGGMYSNYSANEYARQAALIMAAMNSYSGGGGSSYRPGPSGGSSSPGGGGSGYTGPMNAGGSSYDNPSGELYNAGGGWWYY